MSEQTGDGTREWITLGDFARRLGIARASVYGRIKRGTLDAKRANRGGYLVPWPPPDHDGSGDASATVALQAHDGSGNGSTTVAGEVAALRVQVARLQERLTAADQLQADLRASLAREQQRADQLQAALDRERTPLLVRLVRATRWGGSSAA
jgi:hypothetical protein